MKRFLMYVNVCCVRFFYIIIFVDTLYRFCLFKGWKRVGFSDQKRLFCRVFSFIFSDSL